MRVRVWAFAGHLHSHCADAHTRRAECVGRTYGIFVYTCVYALLPGRAGVVDKRRRGTIQRMPMYPLIWLRRCDDVAPFVAAEACGTERGACMQALLISGCTNWYY